MIRTDPSRSRPTKDGAGSALDRARHLALDGDIAAAAAVAREVAATASEPAVVIDAATMRDRLATWAARPAAEVAAPAGSAPVHIGVITYRGLDYSQSSRNLGDHIQTVAMLSHLATRPEVALAGDPGLVRHTTRIRTLVDPPPATGGPERVATLVPVDRDASVFNNLAAPTWTPLFGWLSIPVAGRYAFPMHPLVRPLPISLHIQHPQLLTDATLQWLRVYGPIGCRDAHTVRALAERGVPAFFSGCLTAALGAVVRPATTRFDRPGAIDMPDQKRLPGPAWRRFTHAVPELPLLDPGDALDLALDRLLVYARLPSAATSRLHAYLPLRSIGIPVTLPDRTLDPSRFDGLAPIDDADIRAMARGLRDLLSDMMDKILAGFDENRVYALWRERTMPLVEEHAHLAPDGFSIA